MSAPGQSATISKKEKTLMVGERLPEVSKKLAGAATTEKFEDLSPTQLTVSNSNQSSVDSVSLFLSDLSRVLEPSLSLEPSSQSA